jgi:hypothetical protein
LKRTRPATKIAYIESFSEIENAQDQAKLVKFYKLLMEIDKRLKRDGFKN